MDSTDEEILRILLQYRRTMSVASITWMLNKKDIEISRPTVTKRLEVLKKNGWVVGDYHYNPRKLPSFE